MISTIEHDHYRQQRQPRFSVIKMPNTKKLLIVLYRDFPWYSGLSDRVLGIARQFIKHGLGVKIIAPVIYGYEKVDLDIEHIRLKKTRIKIKLNKIFSLISWIYFQLRCFIKILKIHREIAFIQFEHYYTFFLAYIVKILFRIPIIADDINLVHIRPLPPLLRKIFYLVESSILSKSTLVVTASPMTYAFTKRRFPSTRVLYLPNAISYIPTQSDVAKERWLIFIGNLGFRQNIKAVEYIFRIIEKLAKIRQDFRVLIIGSPLENVKEFLEHPLVKRGVIKFLGSVPNRVLNEILNRAIIALLPFFKLPRWGGQMMKTLRLMSHGICIVASPEAVKWIRGAKPYIHYVPINNIDECIEVLNRLLDKNEGALNIGWNARKLVIANHTWERVCAYYIRVISTIISKP